MHNRNKTGDVVGTIPKKYRWLYCTKHKCDWLWENPPVTHKDNYLEKRN